MAIKTKEQLLRPLEVGDFVIFEVDHRVSRDSAQVQNDSVTGSAATLAFQEWVGQPVKGLPGAYEFAEAGDTITGFVITDNAFEPLVADALTTGELALLVRGPAIINQARLAKVDVYGVALVEATLTAAAEALGIEVKPISVSTEVHTT